jgi:hypothetical protein
VAYVVQNAPDVWSAEPVNFGSTFLSSVTCADAFPDQPCDESLLPAFALEVWGLPVSHPTTDPNNSNFIYQRFERGIMHYSRMTGQTQGLLLGDWLKRVIVGGELPPDLYEDVQGSRFFAQFAPGRPLGLARPAELPETSLALAFRTDAQAAAGTGLLQTTTDLTATAVAGTATSVALTAIAVNAAQVNLQQTQVASTATAAAILTQTALAGVPTATPVPALTPPSLAGCLGDEQMFFVPRRPFIGVKVVIAVTSARRHDARFMRLTGALDTGVVTERQGVSGWIWEWTVIPAVEAFYQFTFHADGLRPCIVSGFNAYVPLGSTPTPTITPSATDTPGPTQTPTNTPTPQPVISSFDPPSGARPRPDGVNVTCNADEVTISGRDFGTAQGTGTVIIGGRRATSVPVWTNSTVVFQLPTGLPPNQTHTIRIITNAGTEARGQYTVGPNCT